MPDFIFVYFTDGGESTGCGLEGYDALACGSHREGNYSENATNASSLESEES